MKANLFAGIPSELNEELVEVLCGAEGVRVERIVSRGQRSPDGFWYDQEWDEFVLVVRGRADLRVEGQRELFRLEAGDHLVLQAHVRHRVEWTEPDQETVWLAVHYDAGRSE